ncbi:hypothetical protein ALC57_12877, partial [Trachymyrmex cornetzi]
ISRAGSCASPESLAGDTRKRSRTVLISFSDSDEESAKKPRGRPARNPANVGRFTAEARARKGKKKRAKEVGRDRRLILNPEVQPSTDDGRNRTEEERTWELEQRKLQQELRVLRAEKAKWERGRRTPPPSLPSSPAGRDQLALGWHGAEGGPIPMEVSDPGTPAGGGTPVWSGGRVRRGGPAPVEGEATRAKVRLTDADKRAPWYRPPVCGVARQMNPLSSEGDRFVPG